MTKKMISWLSILTVFMTLLWSCHNEDFANSETEPQRNNANFFKHQSSTTAKSGVDYVSILEEYNREKDFLTTMPDQKGMPVWDKMQVLDNGGKTVLYVPLSADETGLSSLLIAKVDEKNSVFHLQNFTNDYLKAYVYNTDYPKAQRKLLMDTFLQMDFFTFGHQEFTNLPEDIYNGSLEYNRLNILDAKIEAEQNKGFIYNTICTTYHYCVHGHSASNCDYGNCTCGGLINCFVVTSCSTTATWIDDDPFPSFPGGGGGGGGGGTPGPQPPKDPCTLNLTFYRLAPGCGGGNNTDFSDFDDLPCDKIITENTKAKNLLDQVVIAAQNTTMKTGISTSAIEKAFTFGKDTIGNYAVSNIINGDPSGAAVSMPATNPNFTTEGGIHDHSTQTYDVPSPGDIYWFWKVHHENANFNYYYTNGANTGAEYVYTITNSVDFANFTATYPELTYFSMSTHSWNISQNIGIDFNLVYNYFVNISAKTDEESMELATAFVIAKYGMGIGISKKDTSGNFKPIFVKEIEVQVPTGNPAFPFTTLKTYEATTDCNLK